ncbi:hypothetical protein CcI156_12630 [Frankia sp. CcI156]|nr:hypothetical protein Manayef4_19495 [Frankia sp. CgIM4]OHV54398.1 hypothetical protein CgIS1_12705 [Frankia sp. CgIS1]ONH25553.1 hypothetical protein CcI156_12630 [Frankia sp. CcI156]
MTLALNTAEPIIEGHYGRAALDAIGCCLLIGWSHIAPDGTVSRSVFPARHAGRRSSGMGTVSDDIG